MRMFLLGFRKPWLPFSFPYRSIVRINPEKVNREKEKRAFVACAKDKTGENGRDAFTQRRCFMATHIFVDISLGLWYYKINVRLVLFSMRCYTQM
jgi:hypothetical protein